MNVEILSLVEGARAARGLVVVIDVFRASSTIAAALAAGAERIIPVGELEEAYALKEQHPDFLLFGERQCIPPPGFDAGNSPSAAAQLDLSGKTIILTTSAGTQGIVNATNADEIIIGGFVNARAVADYALARQPEQVNLLAMGVAGVRKSLEDEAGARYIRSLIFDEEFELEDELDAILEDPEATKFFDPNGPLYCPDDVHMSLAANIYSIVPQYVPGTGLIAAQPHKQEI